MILGVKLSRNFKGAELFIPSEEEIVVGKKGSIVLRGIQPGENRWIGLRVPMNKELSGKEGLQVSITEIVDNIPINGFTIAVKKGNAKDVFMEAANLHANNYSRIAKLFGLNDASEESTKMVGLLKEGYDPGKYSEHLKNRIRLFSDINSRLIELNKGKDPFGLKKYMPAFKNELDKGNEDHIVNYHSAFSQKLDSFITYLDKQIGDVADVIQNIEWQKELFKSNKQLMAMDGAESMIRSSEKFVKEFSIRKVTVRDYGTLLGKNMNLLRKVASSNPNANLDGELDKMVEQMNNPQKLQKSHADFLLKLMNFISG